MIALSGPAANSLLRMLEGYGAKRNAVEQLFEDAIATHQDNLRWALAENKNGFAELAALTTAVENFHLVRNTR